MDIRPANMNDLPGILDIEQKCFGEERFSSETVRAFIEREDCVVVLALEGGLTVGSAMCMFSKLAREGRIVSVAVLKELRSKGIGGMLLQECENIFRSHSLSTYTLEVETSNEPAIRLYLKHGYETVGIINDYYSAGRAAYVMDKRIVRRS